MDRTPKLPEDRDPLVLLRTIYTGVQWAKLAQSRRLWSGETQTFTITSIDTGASVWRIGATDRITHEGGIRLKPPGAHFRTVSVEQPSAMTVLRIDSARLSRLGPSSVQQAFSAAQLESPVLLRRFLALRTADSIEEALVHLLVELTRSAGLSAHAEGRAGLRTDVARVRTILDQHSCHGFRLEELAQLANLHPVSLVRLFRQEYGLPPHAYLIERRIEAAQSLLASGKSPCEVALSVGFCDQSHLHRHFKRRTGLTPDEFRHQEQLPRPGPRIRQS